MDYFTSDLHFGHQNLLGFDNRPFSNSDEMTVGLIERWNARVTARDTVYVLGDMMWSMKPGQPESILAQLHGHIILVRGNHDDRWLHGDAIKGRFLRIVDYLDLKVPRSGGTRLYVALSHYPIPFYNHAHHGGLMLYGHVHATSEYEEVKRVQAELNAHDIPCHMYNVFCGLYDWAPATLEEIVARGV
jgi:calcineurin-like phosphoesterase family protein